MPVLWCTCPTPQVVVHRGQPIDCPESNRCIGTKIYLNISTRFLKWFLGALLVPHQSVETPLLPSPLTIPTFLTILTIPRLYPDICSITAPKEDFCKQVDKDREKQ